MSQPHVQIPPKSEVRTAAILAGVIVVVVASATIYYLANRRQKPIDPTPRLNAPVEEIAKFVSTREFIKLPFESQRRIMEVLDDREAELDRAYLDKKLVAHEYRRALEYGWFGKQIPRMEKYHSLRSAEQVTYIDERLDKKEDKGRKDKKGGGGGGGDADSTSSEIDVKRDEDTEKDIPKSWPPEWREKWKKYREALKDRREEREIQREIDAAAAQSAQSSKQN